jgi:hypothetical protein
MGVSRYELKKVLVDLKDKFGESKLKRAARRLDDVTVLGADTWSVVGNPKLGDQYSDYVVDFDGHGYTCTCQDHGYGEYRSICTHIVAVIIWRRLQRETTGKFVPNPGGMAV